MNFRMTANVEFTADDLDDALHELGCHFLRLYYHGVDIETIFRNGKITLEKIDAAAETDKPDAV